MSDIIFKPPSTIDRFMCSSAFGRLIAGPVGSGKTTGCIMELLRRACAQDKGDDGRRYTRFAIARQTYKQLKDTVLKDIETWCSRFGRWKVSDGIFYIDFNDVYSEWLLIPLEDPEDQRRLLSMQLTGGWLSEAIEMNYDIVAPLSGRCTRYPTGVRGVPSWSGLIADTNFPVEGSEWWKLMEQPPMGWEIFRQPGGLEANAENLPFLNQTSETRHLPQDHPARIAAGRRYYERFIEMYGERSDWVNRYVHAKYGADPSGEAVFKNTFLHRFHVLKGDQTMVVPGYPLIIAQDFGRNPWSLICQVDHRGRLIVHEEIAGVNVGLEKHIMENLRPRLYSDRYMGSRFMMVGDPAGVAKSSQSEEDCFATALRLGIPGFPAYANEIEPRLRAVETMLLRQVDGGPALMINEERCPMLVRGMEGGYRFKKNSAGALRPKPDKDDKEGFSHVADCLQYAAEYAINPEYMQRALAYIAPRPIAPRPKITAAGWT